MYWINGSNIYSKIMASKIFFFALSGDLVQKQFFDIFGSFSDLLS